MLFKAICCARIFITRILQWFIFFEFSYSQNVKIRVIKRLVVKLGYKQGRKAPTGTVRLRFRLGLVDPR